MALNRQYFNHLSGRFSEIRQEYKAGRKDLLVETVQKMAKQVNQRFYRLEKTGVGLGENAYRYAQKETGKEKPRYTESINKLKQMPRQELYELALQINKKLVTPSSTIGGTRMLYEKRLEASSIAIEQRFGVSISKDQLLQFINAGGDRFLNDSHRFSSGQIMKDYEQYVLDGKVITEKFIEQLQAYQEKTSMKYSDLQRDFRSLNKRR